MNFYSETQYHHDTNAEVEEESENSQDGNETDSQQVSAKKDKGNH